MKRCRRLTRRGLLVFALAGAAGCGRGSKASQDKAWRRIQAALDGRDQAAIVQACEVYLSASPQKDPAPERTATVVAIYRRAFVRWFVGLGGPPDEADKRRIERYRELTKQFN
jgi:hypothetical protein